MSAIDRLAVVNNAGKLRQVLGRLDFELLPALVAMLTIDNKHSDRPQCLW